MRDSPVVRYGVMCALAILACRDPMGLPPTGAIRVVASTTGVDFDANGYYVRINTETNGQVLPNGTLLFAELSPGPRSLRISDVAQNCSLPGGNFVNATVVASDTVDATFSASCLPNVGSIFVQPVITGSDVDPDGFSVSIDDGPATAVPPSGLNGSNLAVGAHSVTLSGVSSNCTVQQATITVQVSYSQSTLVQHRVSCRLRAGRLDVQVTTTGTEIDDDGYYVEVEGVESRAIPSNGTQVFATVREGNHTVTLSQLSPNCSVAGENPKLASITDGGTVLVSFQVSCSASARLRVLAPTTGLDPDLNYVVRVSTAGFNRTADLTANNSVTIAGLATGSYDVALESVAVNCAVGNATPSPKSVALVMGSTIDVSFDVACAAAGQLAFVKYGGKSEEIFTAKVSGGPHTQLTDNTAEEQDLAYSPDGAKIAFRSTRDGNTEIYVMNADGSQPVRLTSTSQSVGDYHPDWSPDGAKIAFMSNRDGNDEIYVMNADGSDVVRLTTHSAADSKPTWSPDGTKIAFMSNRAGPMQIWVMNADGSNPTQLSTGDGDALPAWSPDGTRIAFTRWFYDCANYYYGCANIMLMNADGTNVVRLQSYLHETEPTWSPDGKWIAFEMANCDYYTCYAFGILAMRPDGKGRTEITTTQALNPTWRP